MKRLDITNKNNVDSVIVKGDRLQQLLNCETFLKEKLDENYSQPIINSMAYAHEIQCEITALEHDKMVTETELREVKKLCDEHLKLFKDELSEKNILSINLYKSFNSFFEPVVHDEDFNIKGLTKFLCMYLGNNVRVYDMGLKDTHTNFNGFNTNTEDETQYESDAFESFLKSLDLSKVPESDLKHLKSAMYTNIYNKHDLKRSNESLRTTIKGMEEDYKDSQKEVKKYYSKYHANRWMFYLGLGVAIGSIALKIFM